MKRFLSLITTVCIATLTLQAQEPARVSCASFLRAQDKADVVIPFRLSDEGKATPMQWGLDLAWLSETNVRTGIFYAGREMIDVIRTSFQPTYNVEEGTFNAEQKKALDERISIIKRWLKPDVSLYLNCDHPTVDPWYNDAATTSLGRGQRWAKLIDLSADYYKSKGLANLTSILPFNEPDFGWDQGLSTQRMEDFRSICKVLREDGIYKDKYAAVRLCGGNTLNNDRALEWWRYSKDYLNEGNTHQLAGSFNTFADFYKEMKLAGHHATADELHNVMECMVGAEYGLQTGIWWGTNEYTRSQFMKATYHRNPGKRLAYAEHRNNWTAASIYRHADGSVQAFGGMSERQSATTRYDFVATDRPVWYDGQRGRNYVMYLPGGTGYQQGQSSAEVTVNVQSGDDVMPRIEEGVYKLVNVNSGKLAGFTTKPQSEWTALTQRNNNNTYKFLQWKVTPLRTSGDFSYYTFVLNTDNDLYLDLLNWNFNSGADVGVYPGGGNVLEQWYLEYAGQGAFYIRNRYSTKCLEVEGGKTTAGAKILLGEFTGQPNQQWRFVATNTTPDQQAPAAPTNVKAAPQPNSIQLSWTAPADRDIKEYVVLRNGYVHAKEIVTTSFTDNEAEADSTYTYQVYAIDKSLNYGGRSETVTGASTTDEQSQVMHLSFNSTLSDNTVNANHAAIYGESQFLTKDNREVLNLSGVNNYVQLPFTIANHNALSISVWLYYRGGNIWQRAWDFGNGPEHYMFLTTNAGSGPRFAIKNGGNEESVSAASRLTINRWHHLVVTIGDGTARLYINGKLEGENTNISIKPSDIRPTLNYIGRSQFINDPYLMAYVDEFQVYNYALSAEEVADMTTGIRPQQTDAPTSASPTYNLNGQHATQTDRLLIKNGKKMIRSAQASQLKVQ
ncbi:MAG: LamG-like jellyroll fold domain-containing protein [Bacteroidaceae bacterium]|nr:LamG-like jellyroll fold domain-containing protein [Bacteroidaceae bacterium]